MGVGTEALISVPSFLLRLLAPHSLTHTIITPVCRLEALLRAMEAKMALLARQLSDCLCPFPPPCPSPTPVCRLEALLRAMEAKMALLARHLSDCEAHRRKFEV